MSDVISALDYALYSSYPVLVCHSQSASQGKQSLLPQSIHDYSYPCHSPMQPISLSSSTRVSQVDTLYLFPSVAGTRSVCKGIHPSSIIHLSSPIKQQSSRHCEASSRALRRTVGRKDAQFASASLTGQLEETLRLHLRRSWDERHVGQLRRDVRETVLMQLTVSHPPRQCKAFFFFFFIFCFVFGSFFILFV